MKYHSSRRESKEPSERSDPSPYQLRLSCGTASRLLEFRSKVGLAGILSSASEREPCRDRLNGHGKAPENVVSSSQGMVERRSRGERASRDSKSMGECGMSLPAFDIFGVDVLPVRWLSEHPFSGSSRLVIAGAEGLEPSSMSKCRMSIVYHSGNLRVGTWKGSLLTAAVFLPQPPSPMTLPHSDDAYKCGCNAKSYVGNDLRLVRRY